MNITIEKTYWTRMGLVMATLLILTLWSTATAQAQSPVNNIAVVVASEVDPAVSNNNGAACVMLDGSSGLAFGAATVQANETDSTVGNNSSYSCLSAAAAFDGVTVAAKVLLGGAYDVGSGTMRTALRTLPDFPLASPYGDGATLTDSSVLTTGNIVDWVLIELRASADLNTVVASRGALLQADGDIVDLDGQSALAIADVAAGDYHVMVRHRNHLAAMTATPVTLSTSLTAVDFTDPATATYGSQAQRIHPIALRAMLWAGDADGNGYITGAGAGNDATEILRVVLTAPGNVAYNHTYIATGYLTADLNLDGQVIASGGNTDTAVLLANVVQHPLNALFAANFMVTAQLP